MPSLQDIAEKLQVSPSLVSKVLNNRLGNTGARQELVEKIRATAAELNYRQNVNALALKSGKQQAFAVLIHRCGQPGSAIIESVIQGIASAARIRQQRQWIDFYETIEEFAAIEQRLHSGAIDGLIVAGYRHAELMDDLLAIQKRGVPVVSIFNEPISDAFPNIGMSESAIVEMTTEHLLKLGRRRILHVSSNRFREQGYRRALKNAGIEIDERLCFYETGDFSFTARNALDAIRRAESLGADFDAICCHSDTQAIGALNEMLRRGRRVPDDVAITGVDNSPLGSLSMVPITSVDQLFEKRGSEAVRVLNELVDGKTPDSVRFDPVLIRRESTVAN